MVRQAHHLTVRTRFAPSPTGYLHIGGLRTAAYAYTLAKHNNGKFLLRIEDTDQRRLVPGSVDKIKEILTKFGLIWDEFYIQTERAKEGVYVQAAEKLVSEGHAFYCECGAKNANKEGYSNVLRDPCRDNNLKSGAIKLKIPDDEKIGYRDYVLNKEIVWETNNVADTTLLKSEELDKLPTYHLAVVVDDHDMQITHALRGHDWMPSTPVHLLVYKYLGYPMPELGHLTDILDPSGGKLSKRKGNVSCEQFIADGYLPEALLNFVILLGWAPKDNRELFTLDEFVKAFDPKGFQKSNPVFRIKKLDWFNGQYIRQMKPEMLNAKFQMLNSKFAQLSQSDQLAITKLVQERITKLSDLETLAGFFWEKRTPDKILFGPKHKKHLQVAVDVFSTIQQFNNITISERLQKAVSENGFNTGAFFMDLRIALTGSKFTPPINESMVILGKEETVERIKQALK